MDEEKQPNVFLGEESMQFANYISVAISIASFAILIALIGLFGDLMPGDELTKFVAKVFPWALGGGAVSTAAVIVSAPTKYARPLRHQIVATVCIVAGFCILARIAHLIIQFLYKLAS